MRPAARARSPPTGSCSRPTSHGCRTQRPATGSADGAMAKKRPRPSDVLGNTSLTTFDVCIIGSGPGGSSAAYVLTAAGKNVLVLEAGFNPWPGLGESDVPPLPQHSNDEIKYEVRGWDEPGGLLQPRTFRVSSDDPALPNDDVNVLPEMLGGGWSHADMKSPRFNVVDF